jgi:signal transduction histidine kinase/CheY-like chemotaxis protein
MQIILAIGLMGKPNSATGTQSTFTLALNGEILGGDHQFYRLANLNPQAKQEFSSFFEAHPTLQRNLLNAIREDISNTHPTAEIVIQLTFPPKKYWFHFRLEGTFQGEVLTIVQCTATPLEKFMKMDAALIQQTASRVIDALEQHSDFLFVYDVKSKQFSYSNRDFFEYLGYVIHVDIPLLRFLDILIYPDDQPAFNQAFEQILAGVKESISLNLRLIHVDGSVLFFHLQASILSRQEGKASEIFGILREAERKKSQPLPQYQQQPFHDLLQLMSQVSYLLLDQKGSIINLDQKEHGLLDEPYIFNWQNISYQNALQKAWIPYIDEAIEHIQSGLYYRKQNVEVNERYYHLYAVQMMEEYSVASGIMICMVNVTEIIQQQQNNILLKKEEEKLRNRVDRLKQDKQVLLAEKNRIAEQEEKLHQLFDQQQTFILRFNSDLQIIFYNKPFQNKFLRKPGHEIPPPWTSYIFPQDLALFNSKLQSLHAAPQKPIHVEIRMLIDKQIVWVRWDLSFASVSDEGFPEYQAVGIDITEQKRVEEALWSMNERFQLITQATHDAIWDWDIISNKIWWNSAFYQLHAIEDSNTPQLNTWFEKIHPDDRTRVIHGFQDAINNKKDAVQYEYRCLIGQEQQYGHVLNRAQVILDEHENPVRMIGIIMDISESIRRRKELLDIKRRYEIAVEAGKTGVWDWNMDTDEVFIDENLFRLLGLQPDRTTFNFQYWMQQIHPDDRENFLYALQNHLRKSTSNTIFEHVHRKLNHNRQIRWILTRGSVHGTEEDNKRMIGTDTDITEYKEVEEKLITAKQDVEDIMKAKEHFFSVMSHEIRTPLNAVIGMAHLLLQNNPRADQKKLLNTLKFSADNLLTLINDILDYSKIQAGRLEFEKADFDLHNVLQSIKNSHKTLAKDKALKLRLYVDDEVPRFINGDATRLGQILNNLISNAIKFTHVGHVEINVELEENLGKQVALLFEVKDTGIGIEPDKQATIFEPYKQGGADTARHYGGTGLGLAIIKNLVERQGGTIELESKIKKGSAFKVRLNFEKVDQQEYIAKNKVTPDGQIQLKLHGVKVLYVEDVIPNQILMEGFSANWGIDLDLASSGHEAIHKVQSQAYDLILMDIQMPEMDGFETTRRIRAFQAPYNQQVPIIALSAEVSEAAKQEVVASGMNDYLSKPVNPDLLYQMIKRYTEQHHLNENAAANDEDIGQELAQIHQDFHIDFSETDALFGNSLATYRKFLSMTLEEFTESQQLLQEALADENYEAFRRVQHKINGVLLTLQLHTVSAFLLQTKEQIKTGEVDVVATSKQLELYFSKTLHALQEKLLVLA